MEYFASNHPNIWFREQLEKNKTLSDSSNSSSDEPEPDDETQLDLDEEESKTFSIVVEKEENDSSDSGISWTLDKKENQESFINGLKLELESQNKTDKDTLTALPKLTSKFFEDPFNPKPEEWMDWPPEK